MPQGLYFSQSDLYPSYGGVSTRMLSVPEAEDQNTLVDDEDLAKANPVNVAPATSKSIWISVAVVFAVIILLNIKF